MELTSSDRVRKAEFAVKMRGYDCDQVDAFLDEFAAAVDGLLARLRVAEEAAARPRDAELIAADGAATDAVPGEGPVGRALVLAQRMADQLIEEANESARAVRERANAEAEQIRESVIGESEALVDQLQRQRRDLERDLSDLTHWVEQRRESLAEALSGALRGVDEWLGRSPSTVSGGARPLVTEEPRPYSVNQA
jgi:DivIVA domain-containing protein